MLIEAYREAKARLGDPVAAFAEISGNPETRSRYQKARGKGGLVRISWNEAIEISAASYVHTIKNVRPRPVRLVLPDPRDVDGLRTRSARGSTTSSAAR